MVVLALPVPKRVVFEGHFTVQRKAGRYLHEGKIDGAAVLGDSPATRARDFGNEAVCVK